VFLASALALAAAIYFATWHLPQLAKWALERAFPGATVEIRKLEIAFPNRLTAESLVLKSRKDGATLLTLAGGSITFDFDDLRRRQIGEVRLVEPVINASPRLPEAFVLAPGAKSSGKAGVPWRVRRLVCDYGELNNADYGPPGLTIHTKFCFDFKNFSPATAPRESHELVLWDGTANTRSDPPFLRLDLVRAKFDLEGLIKNQTVNALTVKAALLSLANRSGDFRRPENSGRFGSGFAEPASWILGILDIRRIAVRLDDERPEVSDITLLSTLPSRIFRSRRAPRAWVPNNSSSRSPTWKFFRR
jgi:hypothetical protein